MRIDLSGEPKLAAGWESIPQFAEVHDECLAASNIVIINERMAASSTEPVAGSVTRCYTSGMTAEEVRFANLQLLIKEFGSAAEVARRGGTSSSYISQVITRRPSRTGKPRDIGPELARRLEKGCGKPMGWMDSQQVESPSPERHKDGAIAYDSVPARKGLPIGAEGEAHHVSLADGEMWLTRHEGLTNKPGTGAVSLMTNEVMTLARASVEGLRRVLGPTPVTHLNALRLATAVGDSMAETIMPGDVMLIDTGIDQPVQDGIYILRTDHDLLLKRVQRRGDGGWQLISDNRRYESETVAPAAKVGYQVLGRVVYAWHGRTL